jgi:sterol desaturase/sphingolipid hydroxylase (fatty acid hydroxylase superfamily)
MIREWLSANGESAGFLGYWLCLLLFAVIESGRPAFAASRHRQQRWPTNLGIGLLNIGLFMVVPVTAVMAAHWAGTHGIGLLNIVSVPFWLVALATVLIRSLAGYVLHVSMHKFGLLWRIHRIHHSDTHLDVSTGLRNHPLEVVALMSFNVATAMLFGLDPWVLAIVEIIDPMTNIFAHANIRLPEKIDRPLRLLFVTPNMHCLHHSSWQPETDSNYGQIFSFWDRLFGTYSAAPRSGYDAMRIGLNEIDFDHASDIVWQMKLPALNIEAAAKDDKQEKPLTTERGKA